MEATIREIVLAAIADWPPDQAAQARGLLPATAAAQLLADNHQTNPGIPDGESADRLDSWAQAFEVVAAAVREAAVRVRASPGLLETTVDPLYGTRLKRVFPETPKEVPHAR
jgi:hypothetical protein